MTNRKAQDLEDRAHHIANALLVADEPDSRAHQIARSAEALIEELKQVVGAEKAIVLAEGIRQRAERLSDDLDPYNPDSLVPPARPDWLGAA